MTKYIANRLPFQRASRAHRTPITDKTNEMMVKAPAAFSQPKENNKMK